MNHDRKSPEFATHEYIRPNLNWECGHTCEGCPCRIGPSPKGECRATFECSPKLVVKPGESKGHWTCTRPKSGGGKCENGPLPDGTCCNAIPKCQPHRTLRAVRKRAVIFTCIATVLLLFVGISRSMRDNFVNPGPISSVHASEHFAKTHHRISGDASTCAACHAGAKDSSAAWHTKALGAFKDGLAPADLIKRGPIESSTMDKSCLACHQGKEFHQPNMPADFACHQCHKEHGTSGFMPPVDNAYCTACHGSAALMAKSRDLGAGTSPHAFPKFTADGDGKTQPRARPKGGYTEVINAFHTDHPEFRQIKDKVKDANTLKFNHAAHMGKGNMPRELNCADCHQQDSRGEYQLPITYGKHCAECHTLQFDEKTPGLALPHGDPYYVRAFLRSLNIQYEEFGRDVEGVTRREDLIDYIRGKRAGIEGQYKTGEDLEQMVFFSDKGTKFADSQRAAFTGCVVCHDVKPAESINATPKIEKVGVPVRWMTLGKFDHSLHQKGLTCLDCHDVMKSELTSDLNLPSIKSCIDCHSPQGGIDHRCTSCHTYHNPSTPFTPLGEKPEE
ncbi:MAG: hypothetical protein RLZZ398_500 [Verrucomicrobiota bacterium]|jgi:hypothetical protein